MRLQRLVNGRSKSTDYKYKSNWYTAVTKVAAHNEFYPLWFLDEKISMVLQVHATNSIHI